MSRNTNPPPTPPPPPLRPPRGSTPEPPAKVWHHSSHQSHPSLPSSLPGHKPPSGDNHPGRPPPPMSLGLPLIIWIVDIEIPFAIIVIWVVIPTSLGFSMQVLANGAPRNRRWRIRHIIQKIDYGPNLPPIHLCSFIIRNCASPTPFTIRCMARIAIPAPQTTIGCDPTIPTQACVFSSGLCPGPWIPNAIPRGQHHCPRCPLRLL